MLPVSLNGNEALGEQAERQAKGREFGRPSDQERRSRGCALIHVRHPHVEGHGAKLKGKSRHDEDHTKNNHGAVGGTTRERLCDGGDIEAAGAAVQHRHAIEQEARRNRAQHKVLYRRFGALRMVAPHGHERIERQSHQLEADVDHKEV